MTAARRHRRQAFRLKQSRRNRSLHRYAAHVDYALPLIESTENRRTLLFEHVSILEHEGRFADALAELAAATALLAGEPAELYSIVLQSLQKGLAPGQVAAEIATSPSGDRGSEPLRGISTSAAEFTLSSAHPNPFNPVTTVPFVVEGEADVLIDVHDVLGRRVAVLVDGKFGAGAHRARFDAGHLSSGLYFVRAQAIAASGRVVAITQKVMLLKWCLRRPLRFAG